MVYTGSHGLGLSDLQVCPKMHFLLKTARNLPMLKNLLRKLSFTSGLILVLAGCTSLNQYIPAEPPPLTPSQQDKVGAAVESRLVQMLGGTYYDKELSADLNNLLKSSGEGNSPFRITIADRSVAAFYPLPGNRVIISRGLLTGIEDSAELESLLTYAEQLANNIYRSKTTRSMVELTETVLTKNDTIYDPESATIRLARLFQQEACEQTCLAAATLGRSMDMTAKTAGLPASMTRLQELQPAYTLLATALEMEKSGHSGKAIATYLQAAAAGPDEPQILGSLGLAYLRAGQLQPARIHLQNAVKRQPDYYRTLMGLGYLFQQQGELPKANAFLSDSVRLLPTTENLFLLAEIREKIGDTKGAMALYRQVFEVDPDGKLGRTAASRLAEAAGTQ
jgi:tetratricopeptide (TPR) repeat protein